MQIRAITAFVPGSYPLDPVTVGGASHFLHAARHAYEQAGNKDKAAEIWEKCLTMAAGEMQKWQVQSELARLRGEPAPPMPSNPHGDMSGGMGGMGDGMSNPHGEMPPGGEMGGEGNPHGDMGTTKEGVPNPHSGT